MKDLGYMTAWGILEPFPSSGIPTCIDCGEDATGDNDSGWEKFQEDGVTGQALCMECHQKECRKMGDSHPIFNTKEEETAYWNEQNGDVAEDG